MPTKYFFNFYMWVILSEVNVSKIPLNQSKIIEILVKISFDPTYNWLMAVSVQLEKNFYHSIIK